MHKWIRQTWRRMVSYVKVKQKLTLFFRAIRPPRQSFKIIFAIYIIEIYSLYFETRPIRNGHESSTNGWWSWYRHEWMHECRLRSIQQWLKYTCLVFARLLCLFITSSLTRIYLIEVPGINKLQMLSSIYRNAFSCTIRMSKNFDMIRKIFRFLC